MRPSLRPRTWWCAAAVAGAVLSAPAGAQDALLDYNAVREAMPAMKELAAKNSALGLGLHKTMDALASTNDPLDQKRLRSELRDGMVEYRLSKLKSMAIVRPLLQLQSSGLSDQQILDKLQHTELTSVVWEGAFFDKCVRDLSRAVDIPIRLQFRVVQKNTVDMRFQRAPAETILATLCNGFDLRYVIYGGEVVIYKKITPTEDRFLDYQKRHPEVKLKYWEREDASGVVDTKKGGGK